MVLICCTLRLYTYTWGTAILNKRKFLKKFICKGLTYAKSSFSKNNNEVTAVPPNFKKLTGLYYLFIHDIIYCRGQDEVLSWVDIWYYFTNHQNCWQKIEEEQKKHRIERIKCGSLLNTQWNEVADESTNFHQNINCLGKSSDCFFSIILVELGYLVAGEDESLHALLVNGG